MVIELICFGLFTLLSDSAQSCYITKWHYTVVNFKQGIGFEMKFKHRTIDVSDSAVTLKSVSDSYSTHDGGRNGQLCFCCVAKEDCKQDAKGAAGFGRQSSLTQSKYLNFCNVMFPR